MAGLAHYDEQAPQVDVGDQIIVGFNPKIGFIGSVNAGPSLMPFLMTGLGGAGRDVDRAADYGRRKR